MTEQHRREIRSFVLRAGRMTEGQQRAWDSQWPLWGLQVSDGTPDLEVSFGRTAPLVMEIGFGMGHSLAAQALVNPDTNYLGVEVHKAGIGKLFNSLLEQESNNVRVYCEDAVTVLRECIPENGLDGLQIFFPDPWHKKKHNKRRLIQAGFVELIASRLKPGGFLHLATDWENYAEQMLEVIDADHNFSNDAGAGQFSPRPDSRPLTKFERRGQRLGHGVWDLFYHRC
jgi:tRNA (guanine-N7-)-methyltransferase